jgi:pimeloyl-ACP methyl ester carboxylesterase
VSALAVEAVAAVTELAESLHLTIASGPRLLGAPFETPARALTGVMYGSVRGVARTVGAGLDGGLSRLGPLLGESAPSPERDAIVAVLNGVVGDYLAETRNPLAIEMTFRANGHVLPLDRAAPHDAQRTALLAAVPAAGRKLLVLVHGSSMNERGWRRGGHDHGAALARDLGYTPVYLRYNSGLHISTNGAALSELLETLTRAWPVPLEEVTLLGHSMGGLVARSACHVAEERHHGWRGGLRNLICLGSPHHGAPLERGGNWLHKSLGATPYTAPFARLGRLRSAGVTDLRFGNVLDEHWLGVDRFDHHGDRREELALPEGVACFAVAGTTAKVLGARMSGDGLVPLASALGQHTNARLALDFPDAHRFVALGTGHLDLLSSDGVYAAVHDWLVAEHPSFHDAAKPRVT